MRAGKKNILILFLCFGLSAEISAEETMQDLVQRNTAFALDLYLQVKKPGENVFYSPYSISTALAMVYAGAREETEKEMAAALHFSLDQKDLHPLFHELQSHLVQLETEGILQLHIANALWIQEGYRLHDEFKALNKTYYEAGLNLLDFVRSTEKSRLKINTWVEEKTKSRIKDLLAQGTVDQMTRLVLTNAIYFLGKWENTFEKSATTEENFYLSSTETTTVPLMVQEDYFPYGENGHLQVLEMPYEGRALSIIILLPKEKDGLPQLESQLSPENLKTWTSGLSSRKVRVLFPRFKMTQGISLEENLRKMGMERAFTGEADFSGIEPRKELYISAVIHKAFIAVDEKGTEAAAATAVAMLAMAAPVLEEPPEFRADHPFLFFIRDNQTGSILFLGRLLNPDQ